MDGSSFFASFASASTSPKETIQFNGAIDSFPIKKKDVTVVTSSGDHDVGSPKLQITNIVNFGWDFGYHSGQLAAVHKSGVYLAYGILSPGKNVGIVRVVNRDSGQRVLLKGMKAKVRDLAFAHCTDQIVLGIVDEFGNLFVFKIENDSSDPDENAPLNTELLLQLNVPNNNADQEHRLIWCPYLPEDEDESSSEDTSARLLALTHGPVAEMWNIDMVIQAHGKGIYEAKSIKAGRQTIHDHGGAILAASFSPDGTALATASADGLVKFFQVYMHGDEGPRCLHQWKPHDGKPVSSLYFLDNHKDYNPDEQFWKFAVTGCSKNSELKLWSCENWDCLQTLRMVSETDNNIVSEFKAALDLSAKYLLLSDIHKKNVYVLQVLQTGKEKVEFVSVSEFPTPSPFLSMAILDGGVKKVADKHAIGEDDSSDDDSEADEGIDDDESNNSREATVINFVLVQPKSLQECRIVFNDAFSQPTIVDVKQEPKSPPAPELSEAANKITLMSPEVFTSSGVPKIKIKDEPESPSTAKMIKRGAVAGIMGAASGGSSPSREVQDILGDSEEQGGLTAEIVITEDNDDMDEDDDIADSDDTEDSDDLTKKLDSANANAAAAAAAAAAFRIKQEQEEEVEVATASDESDLVIVKKEIKTEPTDPLVVKLEAASLNASLKEQAEQQQQSNKTWPPHQQIKIKQEVPDSPILASGGGVASNPGVAMASNSDLNVQLQMVMGRLADMTALIQTQRAEMQVWREEMRELRREDVDHFKNILDESNSEAANNARRDNKALMTGINTSLKSSVSAELRKMAPQISEATARAIQQAIGQEVQNKVLKSDDKLRDAVQKMVNSRATTDAIAASIAQSLAPSLHSVFKEAFANSIVPAFDKGLQNLFAQVAMTMNKGLKDYEGQLKQHVNKQLSHELKDLKEFVKKNASGKNSNVDNLEKKLSTVIKTEMRNIAAATPISGGEVQSPGGGTAGAAAPSIPTLAELQATVNMRLSEGRFNDAFAAALSANNLPLVVTTCEMVNPHQVFNQVPCPLSQEVLLSLIQQLGHNLESKTDVKQRFIQEAVACLEVENPNVKIHMLPIMSNLHQQLVRFNETHPNAATKLLIMVVHGMIPKHH